MTLAGGAIAYRRLRAPARHGECLIEPPLAAAAALVRDNRKQLAAVGDCGLGLPLPHACRQAREELISSALHYTGAYQHVPGITSPPRDAVILCGHQPQLYHPGVWLKNFVADSLARRINGWAVNLIIDTDTIRSASIRVPAGTARQPHSEFVAFDRNNVELPFEERSIQDLDCWLCFPDRVQHTVNDLIPAPLVHHLWEFARQAPRTTPNLGQCLARSRHQLETAWGLDTLDIPLSHVCETPSFMRFAVCLLANWPQWRGIYNEALAEYRRAHRLRSHTHPAPELTAKDGWLESPFWVWTRDTPTRRALFVRLGSRHWELADHKGWTATIDCGSTPPSETTLTSLAALGRRGTKIRPRALITTLYARLLLGDLFVHGIGGAKYDELTDALMRRWFGVAPPRFLTATATLHLPIASNDPTTPNVRQADHELRDLEFNPERYLSTVEDLPEDVAKLIAEKEHWIARWASSERNAESHDALRRTTASLRPYVAAHRAEVMQWRDEQLRDAARYAILNSREYAFCLFPEENLRHLLLELSASEP